MRTVREQEQEQEQVGQADRAFGAAFNSLVAARVAAPAIGVEPLKACDPSLKRVPLTCQRGILQIIDVDQSDQRPPTM